MSLTETHKSGRYTRRFWVDTETTGLDARKHFAFQLSYFIEENGETLLSRKLEIRPDNYHDFAFTAEAQAVHGWSKEQITALMPESEGYKLLDNDLAPFKRDKLTICGYNVNFDIYFIKQIFSRNTGIDTGSGANRNLFYTCFEPMPFDILQFAQGFRVAGLLELPNLRLETVCAHFGIPAETIHDSMTDILNTYAVYKKLLTLPASINLSWADFVG